MVAAAPATGAREPHRRRAVEAKPGDRIIVESEKVGQPTREGEILEVATSPYGISYDVRWDDGRRTSFRPSAGSARIIAKDAARSS
jgi:hypothetical protein